MKKVFVLLICAICTKSSVFAQAPLKIGWLETSAILEAMPERVKADSDMARYARQFQDELDIMMSEYRSKAKQYQDSNKKMDDAMLEVKGKELQDLQKRIESTQQSAQEKVQEKKQVLYQPIFDKATRVIQSIAREDGYDYIFDKTGTMLYGKESDNIAPVVKAKLGIK